MNFLDASGKRVILCFWQKIMEGGGSIFKACPILRDKRKLTGIVWLDAHGWNCSYYRQNKILPMHQKLWRTKWFHESLLDATYCRNFSFQDVKTTINPKYEVWNMVITKWKQEYEFFLFILNCFPIVCNNMRLPFLFIVFRSSAISLLFSGKSTSKNWNEQGR